MVDNHSIPPDHQCNTTIPKAPTMVMVYPPDQVPDPFIFVRLSGFPGVIIKSTPCHFNTAQHGIQVELMP
ncbi:hypothetical protein GEO21_22830 [Sphingobacterium faecium]|nr:hypothetical protein [Sphingobacterium faecium]